MAHWVSDLQAQEIVLRMLLRHRKHEAAPRGANVHHQGQAAIRIGGAPLRGGPDGLELGSKGVDVLPDSQTFCLQSGWVVLKGGCYAKFQARAIFESLQSCTYSIIAPPLEFSSQSAPCSQGSDDK